MIPSVQISIVVPVYNAEKTLCRCIDSIKSQSFQDFEVILVDDGSTDFSGQQCEQICKEDARFLTIHQKNAGVSSARQTGIDHSHGKYVIHLDSDDWIESQMLEHLYNTAEENGADMTFCDFFCDFGHGNITYVKQTPSEIKANTILKELFTHLHGSCWNKLVRKSCLLEYCISFPPGMNFCEDRYVNARLLCHNIAVAYLPMAFYHYMQEDNTNSIVKNCTSIYSSMMREYMELHPYLLEAKRKDVDDLMKYNIKLQAFEEQIPFEEYLRLFPETIRHLSEYSNYSAKAKILRFTVLHQWVYHLVHVCLNIKRICSR